MIWPWAIVAAFAALTRGARSLSRRGEDFIIDREGLRTRPYNDAAGHCTVGIGHLLHAGRCSNAELERTYSDSEVRAMFRADVGRFVAGVRSAVAVPLNQHELDALTSFAFNVGLGAFERSTLLKRLNAGDRASVPAELMRWNKLRDPKTGELAPHPSATQRRRFEGEMFASGIYRGRNDRELVA